MAYNLVPCDRSQPFLLPPSPNDWLPKDHLARFVVSALSVLDLKEFYKGCPWPPRRAYFETT